MNPVRNMNDYIRLGTPRDLSYIRPPLTGYLTWLSYLQPLIESGVVVLLEDQDTRVDNVVHPISVILARSFPLPDDLPTSVRAPEPVVHRVAEILRHQADVSVHYGCATDFYLPQKRWVAILDAMLRTAALFEGVYPRDVPGGEMYEHLRLCHLLQMELPDFELSPQDIVAVREDDCFSSWCN
jgi:hypothetical protein